MQYTQDNRLLSITTPLGKDVLLLQGFKGTDGLAVSVPAKTTVGRGEREYYLYPGIYRTPSEGDRLVRLRIEEEEAQITRITGSSTCRAFTSGYRFLLDGSYRMDMNDKEYILTSVAHRAYQSWEEGGGVSYGNTFTCIPYETPFRPPRTTPKPLVHGSQTAIVVGPAGEEIYTDEHGRIKVQFHGTARATTKAPAGSGSVSPGQARAGERLPSPGSVMKWWSIFSKAILTGR